jgi:hypothetical protein
MRIKLIVAILVAVAACGDDSGDGDAVDAAGIDAVLPRCHGPTPFGAPAVTPALANVNTAASEAGARLSPDQLTLFLTVDGVLHSSTRTGLQDAFPAPAPLTIPDLAGDFVGSPSLTADGQTLYFTRRVGTMWSIWKAARAPDGSLGTPAAVGELDRNADEIGAYILPDESAIYFADRFEILRAERQPSGAFLAPVIVPGLDTALGEQTVAITPDELIAVVGSSLSTPSGVLDMFTRTSRDQPFADPPVEVGNMFLSSWISPDGCSLYVVGPYNTSTPTSDIWEATRAPQ